MLLCICLYLNTYFCVSQIFDMDKHDYSYFSMLKYTWVLVVQWQLLPPLLLP